MTTRIVRVIATAALTFAVACMLAACAEQAKNAEPYQQVTAEEAIEIMHEETGYIILDVRTVQEFNQGHIPGAINIPVETIGTQTPLQLPDCDQLILIYCRTGNRSKQAAEKLVEIGYTNIVEFGGIVDWPGEIEN